MTIAIDISRDGWTGGTQVSIGDENSGYRLAGPKFNGSSTTLASLPIAADNAALAVATLPTLGAAQLVVERAKPANHYRVFLEGENASVWLTDPTATDGAFVPFKRARLDSRDIENVRRFLEAAQ